MDIERVVDDLLGLAPHVNLVSHVPGRIVFKVRASVLRSPSLTSIEGLAERMPGIVDTRLKLLARTVTIDYDPAVLPPELWDELAALKEHPDGRDAFRSHLEELLA